MSQNKEDKIFNNSFYEADSHIDNFKFEIDSGFYQKNDQTREVNNHRIHNKIHEAIMDSSWRYLNIYDEELQKYPTLDKTEINKIFSFAVNHVEDEDLVDIWAALAEYFEINPTKFYNSLSNYYKDLLIRKLDEHLNVIDNRKIDKLF